MYLLAEILTHYHVLCFVDLLYDAKRVKRCFKHK